MPKSLEPFSKGKSIYAPVVSASSFSDVFKWCGIVLDLNSKKDQFVGTCPFCNKAAHFFVSPRTGSWDCKRCTENGNYITFIRKFYIDVCSYDQTRLDAVSAERKINRENLEQVGIRLNPVNGELVFPTQDAKGEINNLYHHRIIPGDTKGQWIGLPKVSRGLINYDLFTSGFLAASAELDARLWICEGVWDVAATEQILVESGMSLDEHIVIGLTGNSGCPEDVINGLMNRNGRLLFDNDEAGRKATSAISHKLATNGIVPKSMMYLHWPEGLKSGYDMNDLLAEMGGKEAGKFVRDKKNLRKLNIELTEENVPGYDPNVHPAQCTSVNDLLDSVRNKMELSKPMVQSFIFDLAVAHSRVLPDCPLWAWKIGPAGSGKTTQVDLVAAAYPWVFSVDKFTGFLSGFSGGGKDDPSILKKCNGRIFIIKDFTPTLAQKGDLERIFGELRGAYDGSLRAAYRNRKDYTYNNIYFPLIACVTNAIRNVKEADMGERFVGCEINREWKGLGTHLHDSADMAMDAITSSFMQSMSDSTANVSSTFTEQKCMTWGFLQYLQDYWTTSRRVDVVNVIATGESGFLKSLARLISVARSVVERDRDGTPMYRPQAEVPTRLYRQLLKIATSVLMVLGGDSEENRTQMRQIVYKVAMDTAFDWPLEVICQIGLEAKSRQFITDGMQISGASVQKHLQNLRDIGVVKTSDIATGRRGRKELRFSLTPVIQKCLEDVLKIIT